VAQISVSSWLTAVDEMRRVGEATMLPSAKLDALVDAVKEVSQSPLAGDDRRRLWHDDDLMKCGFVLDRLLIAFPVRVSRTQLGLRHRRSVFVRLYAHDWGSLWQVHALYRREHEGAKSLGADDFLPIWIYVVAQSGLPRLLCLKNLLIGLCDKRRMLGETGYCLATLEAALDYLMNLDENADV
jgi:hypothetical protein